VDAREQLRAHLGDAIRGPGGPLAAADRLCRACVDLLPVDGAAVSIASAGTTQGTFGSSGELSRRLDEFQFTLGEGPCLDAVNTGRPVLVGDVGDPGHQLWPAFTREAMGSGVRAVFALPVALARAPVGALDLFRNEAGPLTDIGLEAGLWAAELAALPLLELMTEVGPALDDGDGWDQLASLERVEVYQATGMIIGHLDVDASEALVRLRAYAFSQGLTASEAAWAIVERRVSLTEDESFRVDRERSDGGRT
jgi:GAF domain